MNTRILLVEDNPLTAKGIKYLLEREQYKVDLAPDLSTFDIAFSGHEYALILLDIALPDGDTFTKARLIKEQNPAQPLIFLTAKDDESDIVRGLGLGADDYIIKPFRNRELVLRIKNLLSRRSSGSKISSSGPYTIDWEHQEISVAGEPIALTSVEYKIFSCLFESIDHIVPRKRLLDEIYDASGKIVNDNTLSVYLKRLRRKLGPAGSIETLKGIGYRLVSKTMLRGDKS